MIFNNIYFRTLLPFEVSLPESCESLELDIKNTYMEQLSEALDKKDSENSEHILNKYCKMLNLSRNEIFYMFSMQSDGELDFEIPSWLATIKNIFDVEKICLFEEDRKKLPFYEILLPFINFSIDKIQKELSRDLSNNEIYSIEKFLYNDFAFNSRNVFVHEFSLYRKKKNPKKKNNTNDFHYKNFVKTTLESKYSNFFLKYPMLARILGTKINRNICFITKMLKRLATDIREIKKEFNIELGFLERILFNAGDKHNGETTVILKFENHNKIVYKPTNLEITTAYNKLLDWVNDQLKTKLKKFRIVTKKDYGWMEFVEHYNCESHNELKIYYERAGIIAGLAYFLNTSDYHFENVIASGNCPVLIDHETIIGPKIKYRIKESKSMNRRGSIIESLLIPNRESSKMSEVCGFGSVVQNKGKNYVGFQIFDPNKDTMRVVPQLFLDNNGFRHIPHFLKKPYYLEEYKKEFIRGFKRLYKLILNNKKFLASEHSPLIDFRDKKIRFIFRDTEVYAKLLFSLSKNKNLRDSILYGINLELLSRVFLMDDLDMELLKSERSQITLGDVPVFYINTQSQYIELENDKRVDLFEMSAIDNMQYKIQNASVADCEMQINIIDDALSLYTIEQDRDK